MKVIALQSDGWKRGTLQQLHLKKHTHTILIKKIILTKNNFGFDFLLLLENRFVGRNYRVLRRGLGRIQDPCRLPGLKKV